MMEFLLGMLVGYGLVTVLISLFGVVRYADARGPYPRRSGARMIFGAPLWPACGAVIAGRTIRQAWLDADWKGLKL